MLENSHRPEISAVREIKDKIRLLNSIVTFIIATLFLVIVRYLYRPVALNFLPDFSITLIVGMVFFLCLIGLYLSRIIARQTVRIIRDYSNKLEKLLSITSDLREEMHGDILLGKIMDYALSITQSDVGAILLLHNKNKLVYTMVRGDHADPLLGSSVEVGKGIVGWVAEKGLPLRLPDVSSDKRFNPEIDAIPGFETGSMLCVPLKTKYGITGVLKLRKRKGEYVYRERDEEIIMYLAEQAAISMTKTKFYEDQKNYEIHLTEMLLEAMDYHIPEKWGHSRRVAYYSNIIAKVLNLSEERKKKLYFACLLHDVGFLKIKSDDAYKKEEYIRHPVVGYEMINPINFYSDIAPFILHHHERYDGSGYPSRLRAEEIPLEARIIAVAGAFDSMISQVSYKIPISLEAATEELQRNTGTQFDPEIVDLFVNNITEEAP